MPSSGLNTVFSKSLPNALRATLVPRSYSYLVGVNSTSSYSYLILVSGSRIPRFGGSRSFTIAIAGGRHYEEASQVRGATISRCRV